MTVIVIAFEVAGLPVGQGVMFDVSTQVTISPFASPTFVYVELLVPTLAPLSFHWYDGLAPPFVGVAVNVTDVPEQIGLADAAIDTLTG